MRNPNEQESNLHNFADFKANKGVSKAIEDSAKERDLLVFYRHKLSQIIDILGKSQPGTEADILEERSDIDRIGFGYNGTTHLVSRQSAIRSALGILGGIGLFVTEESVQTPEAENIIAENEFETPLVLRILRTPIATEAPSYSSTWTLIRYEDFLPPPEPHHQLHEAGKVIPFKPR